MDNDLCELRFDIPLPTEGSLQHFEQGWRALLAAQKLTALAMPPAQAVAARFRLCGQADPSRLKQSLTVRLAALPGSPAVTAEAASASLDWPGVKVWLSFRSHDLAALLHKPKQSSRLSPFRGRRP